MGALLIVVPDKFKPIKAGAIIDEIPYRDIPTKEIRNSFCVL
jgi:hypothetical protein